MATNTSFAPSSAAQGFNALAARPDASVNFKGVNTKAKARAASEDFEAVFLNSMFSQMFTHVDGEGPFGGDQSTGVWRSFLTEEYSKAFAKKGGIGIADEVYRSLLAQQEASAR
jgi:Rod binding domain-containing protein